MSEALPPVRGFQQRDRVDQHGLVRDQLCRLFQLGQSGARSDARLQHGLAFKVMPWR